MSVSLFDEWFNHYLEEPFGYEAEVHRHSENCTILANGLLTPKKPYKCEDFRYPYKPKPRLTWQQMLAGMRGLAGGKK